MRLGRGSGIEAEGVTGLRASACVEWFLVGEFERAEQVLSDLRAVGATRLRTGLHWADCHLPEGLVWYDWLLPRLAAELELLPCLTYTPPSIALEPEVNAPPRDPGAYANFVDDVLTRWGRHFEHVELWNEPNNDIDWCARLDPGWERFSDMIGRAAYWVRRRGWRSVLGGMSPVDVHWLRLLGGRGVLAHIDVVGIHGFPGTWDFGPWLGWDVLLSETRAALRDYNPAASVWITEAGHSTWQGDEAAQVEAFLEFARAGAERGYWYAVHDLDPERDHQGGGFHSDERHYHLGMRSAAGEPKLLFDVLCAGARPQARQPTHTGTREQPGSPAVRKA